MIAYVSKLNLARLLTISLSGYTLITFIKFKGTVQFISVSTKIHIPIFVALGTGISFTISVDLDFLKLATCGKAQLKSYMKIIV